MVHQNNTLNGIIFFVIKVSLYKKFNITAIATVALFTKLFFRFFGRLYPGIFLTIVSERFAKISFQLNFYILS